MSKKILKSTPPSYHFEFGSDEKLYTVSFKSDLPKNVPDKILEAAGKNTYEDSGKAIHAYLEKQHLKYSNFEFRENYLNHQKIMEWANTLLHSDASSAIDASIGIADHYYGVMDYQKWIQNDQCEGCYLAIKRDISNETYERTFKYHLIGQTFSLNESDDTSINHFAIRRKNGHSPFHNLYISMGRPVLPNFGCVDMIELLRKIETVHNATQTKDVAIR